MSETYLAEAMFPQEPRLINISVDTNDTSLACILPHSNVALIFQHWFLIQIEGNHQLIVIEFTNEMPVIEIPERIHQRLLADHPASPRQSSVSDPVLQEDIVS